MSDWESAVEKCGPEFPPADAEPLIHPVLSILDRVALTKIGFKVGWLPLQSSGRCVTRMV